VGRVTRPEDERIWWCKRLGIDGHYGGLLDPEECRCRKKFRQWLISVGIGTAEQLDEWHGKVCKRCTAFKCGLFQIKKRKKS
jgi:hypothetical protein